MTSFGSTIDTIISSLLDPNPVTFNRTHEKGVRPVRRVIAQSPADVVTQLKNPIPRNSFLLGCLDFTQKSEIEYLFVGYGRKIGRGTRVSRIEYKSGDETSVSIPRETKTRIQEYLQQSPENEVVIFHNHPRNWINSLIDNLPLASFTDRSTLLREKYLQPVVLLKTIVGTGSIRFYIAENGFVREYKYPNLLSLVGNLATKSGGV